MLDMAAFMVVRDDAYYVDMALKSVLPYLKGIYIQDQISIDGTYEKILEIQKTTDKIVVDRVDTGTKGRFEKNYNEPKFRTMAIKKAEDIFNPAWILKVDADEVFTPYLFNQASRLFKDPQFVEVMRGIKIGGERFISKTRRSLYPPGCQKGPNGVLFPDPHTLIWKAKAGYHYVCNPDLDGYFHPVMSPKIDPVLWLPGICVLHLHRTFGPKSFNFWREGGDVFEPKVPFYAPTMAPKWFYSDRNWGTSEEVDFEWPDYVLEKWGEFGIW